MRRTGKYSYVWGIYIPLFAGIVLLASVLLVRSTSPEKQITGTWKEVQWKYEKVDKSHSNDDFSMEISESVKEEIMKDMIIHEAEVWEFLPGGLLKLHSKEKPATLLHWRLKGRGHILKVAHPNAPTEYYDIFELDKNHLALYFTTDLQARGIVKMTFRRQEK